MPYVNQDRYENLLRYEETERRSVEAAKERFRVKTRCNLCGYQSMDIYPQQNMMCPTSWCEGGMEEVK